MKKLQGIAITLLLLSLLVSPGIPKSAAQDQMAVANQAVGQIYRSENPVPDQYLVVLKNDIEDADLETTAFRLAASYNGVLLNVPYMEGIRGFSIQMKEQDALALSLDPAAGYVEEIPQAGFKTMTLEPETTETEAAETEAAEIGVKEVKSSNSEEELAVKPVEPEEEEIATSSAADDLLASQAEGESKGSLVSPLPTPTLPLAKPDDPKTLYFRYGNPTDGFKTIALFGMSGSFLPHIRRSRTWDLARWGYDPIKENCTLDDVSFNFGTRKPKYQFCVDSLLAAGLNHMQIWVSLNHSVGMLPRERRKGAPTEKVPYPNEQPFKWNGKWDLNTGTEGSNLDAGFFDNLKNVISYCQTKGIIVAVVLFDPDSGWNDDPLEGPIHQPIYSAYYAANNTVSGQNSPYPAGVGFSDPHFFAKASQANPNPDEPFIDDAGPNRFMRNVQLAVMQRTVQALKSLHNFYWVLANEPDMNGAASGKQLIAWHRYMARNLRAYEDSKNGGKHHLIAANLSTNHPNGGTTADDVLDTLKKDTRIDIISGHYVFLRGTKGPVNVDNRYSALKLLDQFNIYTAAGAPEVYNTKRWGFTEGKSTGTAGDDGIPDPLTADAARVEAWEFFLNGGALFDHLSYRWGNPNPADNKTTPPKVLGYFKLLSQFLNPISLDGMKRMTTNQTSKWIGTAPANIAPHWAAMSNGTYFFLYMHRSTYLLDNADRYKVNTSGIAPGNQISVLNLGCGSFRSDWYYPDGKPISGQGGIENGALKAFGGGVFPMPKANTVKFFNTPNYDQDIVMRITKTASAPCQP